MAYNKIILNGETKIDLTQDTATAEDVALGKTFHLNSGETAVGTLEITSEGGSDNIMQEEYDSWANSVGRIRELYRSGQLIDFRIKPNISETFNFSGEFTTFTFSDGGVTPTYNSVGKEPFTTTKNVFYVFKPSQEDYSGQISGNCFTSRNYWTINSSGNLIIRLNKVTYNDYNKALYVYDNMYFTWLKSNSTNVSSVIITYVAK